VVRRALLACAARRPIEEASAEALHGRPCRQDTLGGVDGGPRGRQELAGKGGGRSDVAVGKFTVNFLCGNRRLENGGRFGRSDKCV
jgi:hypothetical protein